MEPIEEAVMAGYREMIDLGKLDADPGAMQSKARA
jgi:hypothetical protein